MARSSPARRLNATALVGAACAALVLVTSSAASGPTPALHLVALDPATFSGSGFAPREHLRLTLASRSGIEKLSTSATRTGTFHAQFAASIDRCSGFRLAAVGARGHRATLTLRPLCPPAAAP